MGSRRKFIVLVVVILVAILVAGSTIWCCAWIGAMRQMGPRRTGDLARDIELSTSGYAAEIIGGLGREGPTAAYAVPVLINLIRKEHFQAGKAAEALGKIGAVTEDVIPSLIEALGNDDQCLRANAAEALGRIGPMAEEAGSALVRLLEDKDGSVRVAAAYALVDIGVHEKASVPVIVDELDSSGLPVDIQKPAIYLGRIGPDAEASLPALLELSKHKDEHLQLAVRSAIAAIRREYPEACINEVVSYIEKGEACFVAAILGMFGHDANSVAPILFEELKAPEKYYGARIEIVKVLPKICTNRKQLIQVMISYFGHNIASTHELRSAMEGLCPEAVPALKKLASDYSIRPECPMRSGAETILVGFKLKSEVRRSQLARKAATRPAK
jgi:HEAT repeat protein